METSFGEYFDAQRDKIRKDMQNKNAQQNIEWMEAYEKRQAKKQELLLLKKMAPVGPKEKKLLKEMIHEKRKEKEGLKECRMFNPIHDFEWWKRVP